MDILRLSPQGQITLPKRARGRFNTNRFAFELRGKTMTLRPVRVIKEDDGTETIAGLAKRSFDFWDNKGDDVYQDFYGE